MTERQQNKTANRILQGAREKFFQHGFSKVTMDELAADLGMSKKTIYKHFPNKIRMLEEVMQLTLREIKTGLESYLYDDSLPILEKLRKLLTFIPANAIRFLNRPFLQDVQKHAPEVWQQIETFRKEMIQTRFAHLLNQGVEQGIFRPDLDQRLVVMAYLTTVQNLITPETLINLPLTPQQVFDSMIKLLFEGLLTDEARHDFQKKGNANE